MKNDLVKSPPIEQLKSLQYSLFTQFFGEKDKFSNTIELWDAVPKYFVSKQAQTKKRDEKGNLQPITRSFEQKNIQCRVVIQPAFIEQKDGNFKAFYPSASEELVEDVLRKFFSDQQHGFHNVNESESWVRFSLYMIKKELSERGKTRSLDQIKESLEILSGSVLKLYIREELVYTNAILGDMTKVTRQQYLKDPSTYWMARLPALISKSINDQTYRQYNYSKMMELKTQAARGFMKRLSHHFTGADHLRPYGCLLSSVIRDTGLFPYPRIRDQVRQFEVMLKELIEKGVLKHYNKEERKGKKNKIEDVHFKLYAHTNFVKDMIAANGRKNMVEGKLQEALDFKNK